MPLGSELYLDTHSFGAEAETPLSLKELKALVRQGEGQQLEFKAKVKFPEKIVRGMVAFANAKGGHLLLGVADDGALTGLKFAEEDQFAMEQCIERCCYPAFSYLAYQVPLDNGRSVLVYRVFESVDKPHFVQLPTESQGTCYVRVKDKSIQASKEVRQILRRSQEEGIVFTYGQWERWLMQYLKSHPYITVQGFASQAGLPPWLASRKLILLVLSNVLQVIPDDVEDRFQLK